MEILLDEFYSFQSSGKFVIEKSIFLWLEEQLVN